MGTVIKGVPYKEEIKQFLIYYSPFEQQVVLLQILRKGKKKTQLLLAVVKNCPYRDNPMMDKCPIQKHGRGRGNGVEIHLVALCYRIVDRR